MRTARRKNPLESAASLSEAWHGRPSKSIEEVTEKIHTHSVLTKLGRLMEIGIADGKYEIPIAFGKGVTLCSSEDGRQLYLVGGNQEVDVKPFDVPLDKDLVVLGEASSITYWTAKMHLNEEDKTPGPYRHEFADENGERPTVLYECLNHLVLLAGGTYNIKRDMDAGKHSAGIRN